MRSKERPKQRKHVQLGAEALRERLASPNIETAVTTSSKEIAAVTLDRQSVLSIVASAAADPAVQPEKMRALLDMQKEIRQEEARIAFNQDFIAMSHEMPSINKDGKIIIEKNGKVIQRTPYSSFENIHKVVGPILRKFGFAMWSEPDIGAEGVGIIMRGHLDHIGGHGKSCAIPLPLETSGSKNNVQGVGSSISYGRRYCAISLLNLVSHAPEDRDDDGNGGGKQRKQRAAADEDAIPLISDEQVRALSVQIDAGVGLDRFCEKYGIKGLPDLPGAQYADALAACKAYAAAKANRKGNAND